MANKPVRFSPKPSRNIWPRSLGIEIGASSRPPILRMPLARLWRPLQRHPSDGRNILRNSESTACTDFLSALSTRSRHLKRLSLLSLMVVADRAIGESEPNKDAVYSWPVGDRRDQNLFSRIGVCLATRRELVGRWCETEVASSSPTGFPPKAEQIAFPTRARGRSRSTPKLSGRDDRNEGRT
jgi:hypothetical protein